KEGMLTNFILDVIQSTMETDLAFLGAAAISGKEIMPAGNVTLGDIFGWFPNERKIMTMKLKGSTIKKTLDVMVRELPAEAPSFPHPSQQLRFTINMMRKPPIVEDIFIRGQPLDYNREYLCAVEDFVGIGKAKYKHVAAEGQVILGEDDAVQVVTMVRDFFLKRKASDVDAKEAAALKNVTKIVSSATHIGVDMDMAKSQRFVRSLICELMHCDKSSIFLVNQADQTIHFMPDPKGDQKPTTITMPLGVGLAGSCA
ncbi:5'-nucleotidase-like, putative, partial [Bodo saltans]